MKTKINELEIIKYIQPRADKKLKKKFNINQYKKFNKNIIGICDDTAVIPSANFDADCKLLITTDTLIECVHFNRFYTPDYLLGKKAALVNFSDILSTGGVPVFAFLNLAITADFDYKKFIDGFIEVCQNYSVKLLGGDTVLSKKDNCISVTVIGVAKKILLRSAAGPGQLICCTGDLGL